MFSRQLYAHEQPLGYIIGGSLQEGLRIALYSSALSLCGYGSFVILLTSKAACLAMVTDISLSIDSDLQAVSDPRVLSLLKKVHEHASSYHAVVHVLWEIRGDKIGRVQAIPECFSYVYAARPEDIIEVWNQAHPRDTHFVLGKLAGNNAQITAPLKALVKRSNAIFGKTGTGKTFFARYLIGGMIAHKIAAFLIFDMHSEYAYTALQEHTSHKAEGLKILFPGKVLVATLDKRGAQNRKKLYDFFITIPITMIHIEDVLALQRELALHATACEAAYLLYARFSAEWLSVLMNRGGELNELAREIGAHVESLAALHRKLKRIVDLPFVSSSDNPGAMQALDTLLNSLAHGISVIIEFGAYNHTISYLFIANILTRLLHDAHIKKTGKFLENAGEAEPAQVVIVIEEAHKFLHPALAQQTAFGMIAREMRKYYLSLFIIDQRPSHIDDEILSQLGTKFLLSLTDPHDCDAALCGIERAGTIKHILETLSSRQELVVVGHTASLPVKIRVADYSSLDAYAEQGANSSEIDKVVDKLFA